MASSKDSKTSKTAHVMNLLSRNRGGAEPAAEAPAAPEAALQPAAASPQPAETVPAAAPKAAPPILTSLKADAEVSSQIKDALVAELGEAPAKPAEKASRPAPAPAAVPAEEPPAAPIPPVQAPQPVAVEEPAPEVTLAPEPPTQPEETADAAPEEDVISYVNVMQVLVEEKAEKYMEMFGICHCSQCRADVKAYALNHLQPKYVVMGQREMIPKLTFYEAQNSSDITAQIIKACKIVMNTPHHSR